MPTPQSRSVNTEIMTGVCAHYSQEQTIDTSQRQFPLFKDSVQRQWERSPEKPTATHSMTFNVGFGGGGGGGGVGVLLVLQQCKNKNYFQGCSPSCAQVIAVSRLFLYLIV